MNHYSIAIDGPAASGKSTAAKIIARRLGFLYVDTGAMYRAFTLHMLDMGLDTKSPLDAHKALEDCRIREDREGHVYLNGQDVTKDVRSERVSSEVSYACAHSEVRKRMVELQQEMARGENVIMDGRDIGTVVLPSATLKIYQVASSLARAQRRQKENVEKGISTASVEEIQKEIEKRDYIDSHRENSPLRQAEDAILLDTSNLSIEEEVSAIVNLFKERIGEEAWNSMVQSH